MIRDRVSADGVAPARALVLDFDLSIAHICGGGWLTEDETRE